MPSNEVMRSCLLMILDDLRKPTTWDASFKAATEKLIVEALASGPDIGNNAAMRNALIEIERRTNSLDEECGVDPVEIRDIARKALAAPARNVDRFESGEDAEETFVAEMCRQYENNWEDPRTQCKGPCESCIFNWSFAKAEAENV